MSIRPLLKSALSVLPLSTRTEVPTSASSPSVPLPAGNAGSSATLVDQTDWERVREFQRSGAPIPYDPNDPDDGPYDPNDDAAVDAFWEKGERLGLVTRGLTPVPTGKDRTVTS